MLINDFDKTSVLAFFNNSFLKIKLNCDKENMLISNTYIFQKKMLSNLTCILIYLLCSEDFVKLAEIYPWQNLLLRKLQYLESSPFLTKCSTKYNCLGIYKIFNIQLTGLSNVISIRNNKFWLFKFRYW